MNLKNILHRKVEHIEKSATAQEREAAIRALLKALDVVLPLLTPTPLEWKNDQHDPDLRFSIDPVLAKVWQVEDLADVVILRVYNSRKELVYKERARENHDMFRKIEMARARMFSQGTPVEEAMMAFSPEKTADLDVDLSTTQPSLEAAVSDDIVIS